MFYNQMEKVIKEQGERGLIQLEFYYGIELSLGRQLRNSDYSDVHGADAGQPVEEVKVIKGMLQGDDFFEANTTQTPAFVAGFLYSRDKDIRVGDVIHIASDPERSRRYKIIALESIGLTLEVFRRWKLSAQGN